MLKRHRSSTELLPHDVVELILERLPVKYLLSFKCVSKKWKSTIESRRFQEQQLIRRRQSRGADVFFVNLHDAKEARIVLESSIFRTIRFPFSNIMACYGSCDGLVCLYCLFTENIVVNPVTQWHRSFPFSWVQQLINDRFKKGEYFSPTSKLGFGKDKYRGTYKPVWLYNSCEFGLDNITTCEVFDFSINDWRYIVPIIDYQKPVSFDGSLYWITECVEEEIKIISLDLHTESFQVISKAPFAHVRDPHNAILCVLSNRLCVSFKNWPTQVIWSLDSGSNKTWKKMCSIDVTKTVSWFGGSECEYALLPVAFVGKNKLLLHGRDHLEPQVIYDLQTKSFDLVFKPTTTGHCVHYFESLLSVLSSI